MDGAPTFSAGLAQSKAVSSVTFGRATSEFESAISGRPVFAIGLLQHGSWYAGRGGAPIVVDGQVVGAVGVSGNTGEREDELAKEAAARAAIAIGAGDTEGVSSPLTGKPETAMMRPQTAADGKRAGDMEFWQALSFTETEQLIGISQAAEAAGFTGVAFADHLVTPSTILSPLPLHP